MKEAPNKNKYKRSRSIFIQLLDTYFSYQSSFKMGFFDFFVYRWYKNFIE